MHIFILYETYSKKNRIRNIHIMKQYIQEYLKIMKSNIRHNTTLSRIMPPLINRRQYELHYTILSILLTQVFLYTFCGSIHNSECECGPSQNNLGEESPFQTTCTILSWTLVCPIHIYLDLTNP